MSGEKISRDVVSDTIRPTRFGYLTTSSHAIGDYFSCSEKGEKQKAALIFVSPLDI